MGTLTADCPRLDSHCPHKLATSCRLTSTPNCCACADERPHSANYRVYVDGVGFVYRGTRWQGYCWFCKEFWNNRLASTDPPLEASQTKIPLIPDQTEFLERWFEFHQGYRIVNASDGTESRIAVIGEPFREVSPGFLPRTLDQLRAGRLNDESRAENRFRRRRLSSEEERAAPAEQHQTIEEALDSLLEEISDDEIPAPAPAQTPASDMPRAQADPPRPLSRTGIHLQRARDRLVRVFGSREDVQRDDYESPLSAMYNRAFERYRQAEARRESGDTTAPSLDGLSEQERRDIENQIMWGVLNDSRAGSTVHITRTENVPSNTPAPASPRRSEDSASTSVLSYTSTADLETVGNMVRRLEDQIYSPSLVSVGALRGPPPSLASFDGPGRHPRRLATPPLQTLDQPNRPPPLMDEQMTKNLSCQVCYSQVADIAVLPCGHMVMCEWCADVVVPVRHGHVPARPTKCPMCRKSVKQRFKIHMG
ncbi:hypothetical protein K458DRAFT_299272 [Lentithecium fluviatile CBS 122367]|uniref:RING-type domain-containing protein n=1 Tax=Lentithecium fluviatile CBS 122367 TaxID=1168545 RepID=A0A6G1J8B7_9PLEO|nr:hypothetical protein K458DRAFT_299272 [Lentithecium fluviatile CBS 122367]